MELVQKTESEISLSDEMIAGDICIGTGETDAMHTIARTAKLVQEQYPYIRFHIASGDTMDLIDKLDKGLFDFSILFNQVDTSKYEALEIPMRNTWGVLMRKDSPLAEKEVIEPKDLWDKPLILSRQITKNTPLAKWLKKDLSSLNIAATYNLIFNASIMAEEGIGYVLGLDKLINVSGESELCFRKLEPPLEGQMNIVWKKYRIFTKATQKFIEALKENLS